MGPNAFRVEIDIRSRWHPYFAHSRQNSSPIHQYYRLSNGMAATSHHLLMHRPLGYTWKILRALASTLGRASDLRSVARLGSRLLGWKASSHPYSCGYQGSEVRGCGRNLASWRLPTQRPILYVGQSVNSDIANPLNTKASQRGGFKEMRFGKSE
jgi:hypothetical protein